MHRFMFPIAAAAALIAGGAWFVVGSETTEPQRDDATLRRAAEGAAVEAAEPALVDSPITPLAAPSSALSDGETPSPSRTAAAPADVPCWNDFLAPVDSESGAPVGDVLLVHFASDGVRTEHALTDPVLPMQLADDALAALDGPLHLPRLFLPRELVGHVAEPQRVRLAAAGSFELRAADASAEELLPLEISISTLSLAGVLAGSKERVVSPAVERAESEAGSLAFDHDLRAVYSASSSLEERRAFVHALLSDEAVVTALRLAARPHPISGFSVTRLAVDALPFVVGELEYDRVHQVQVRAVRRAGLALESDPALAHTPNTTVTLVRGEPTIVLVKVIGTASVRVAAPAAARDVRIEFANGDQVRSGGDSSSVVFDDVVPGYCRLLAQWLEPDGSHAVTVHRFELGEGETKDLGELTAERDMLVRVVPRVFARGEFDALLHDELASDFAWSMRLDFGAGLVFHGDFERLEPFVLHAPRDLRGTISVEHAELPRSLRASRRVELPEPSTRVRFERDTTVFVDFDVVNIE